MSLKQMRKEKIEEDNSIDEYLNKLEEEIASFDKKVALLIQKIEEDDETAFNCWHLRRRTVRRLIYEIFGEPKKMKTTKEVEKHFMDYLKKDNNPTIDGINENKE